MVVAKRQGREKLTKIEQRKVKGRSEHLSENLRWSKQHSWLAQFTQGRPRGRKNTKRSWLAQFTQGGPRGRKKHKERSPRAKLSLFSSHL